MSNVQIEKNMKMLMLEILHGKLETDLILSEMTMFTSKNKVRLYFVIKIYFNFENFQPVYFFHCLIFHST